MATLSVLLPQAQPSPGMLKHLQQLTRSFVWQGKRISYIHVYAAPDHGGAPLAFIPANESGFEGIACVDDAARAVLLACQVHAQVQSPAALQLARSWCDFIAYMQGPDGRFANFIADASGAKNLTGRTSRLGGAWWTARALRALAVAYRATGDKRYLRSFEQGHFVRTGNVKIQALEALALLDLYACGQTPSLRARITTLCDRIVASGPGYFRDRKGQDDVALWGYHQLQAVARAGQLLSRLDYLAACESTVHQLIEAVIAGGFYHTYPQQPDGQCAYCIAPLVLGLEDLYRWTSKRRYRDLALECASWLYGKNHAGRPLYDPRTGHCADGITQGSISANCGAESAIEAGFIELARQRLLAATPDLQLNARPTHRGTGRM